MRGPSCTAAGGGIEALADAVGDGVAGCGDAVGEGESAGEGEGDAEARAADGWIDGCPAGDAAGGCEEVGDGEGVSVSAVEQALATIKHRMTNADLTSARTRQPHGR